MTEERRQPRIVDSASPTVQYRYRHGASGRELLVFWKHAECSDAIAATSATREAESINIDNSVIVDLLSGRIWRYPPESIERTPNKTIFRDVPLTDWPLMITDHDLFPLRAQ